MYGKIFEMMYEGSLYGQWEAIVTFQQMIVLADDEGFIDITPFALSSRTSIPLDIIHKGIDILEQPDTYSRTPDEEGKRIVRISKDRPWGWQIINYQKYKNMSSYEDRKKYMRDYMRERRKQEKLTSKQQLAELTHKDIDKDIDKDNIKTIVSHLNLKTGKNFKHNSRKTVELINARANEGFKYEDFFIVIDNKCHDWLNDAKMHKFLRPITLFGTKFESYLNDTPREFKKSNIEPTTYAQAQNYESRNMAKWVLERRREREQTDHHGATRQISDESP